MRQKCVKIHWEKRNVQNASEFWREGVELLKDLHRVLKNPPPLPFLKKPAAPSEEAAHLLFPSPKGQKLTN